MSSQASIAGGGAAAAPSPVYATTAALLRVDPPVPASLVKKPKLLRLQPAPPAVAAPPGAGDERRNAMQPPVEDILSAIMKPTVVGVAPAERAGQAATPLVQCVSTVPATRLDVIRLQEQLDTLLMQRQARDSGVCAVRSELFARVFDELIRQVTLNSPERGLLLLRVRDELRMTLEAYRALYEASVEYGARNAALFTHANERLGVDSVAPEHHQRLHQLREQKRAQELKVIELQRRAEAIETESLQQRKLAEQQHAAVMDFYLKSEAQLNKLQSVETNRAGGRK